ncbi:MAG: SEC-C metal-binding domain-containing protein [Pseudomonadota bacterium]
MKYSYDFFPDYPLPSALKLMMSAGDPLPEGDYALIDYYSPNVDAAQTITIQVVQLQRTRNDMPFTEESLAAFDYKLDGAWSDDNPKLQATILRTPLVDQLLLFFKELLETNLEYKEELSWRAMMHAKDAQRRQELSRALPEHLMPQMPIRKTDRTQRNDPCPCGSGKKFKKCCM